MFCNKMESWSYAGKGFASDDSVSASGGLSRSNNRNGLKGCELKTPWNYVSSMMCSSQGGNENHHFLDLGSSDMMRKSLPSDSIGDIIPNALSSEIESCSKLSSSAVESNCRDTSFIDLKLGNLNDHLDAKNHSSSKAIPNLSSAESSIPVKRARAGGLGSQTPYCQVHGCRKDLSSCKDYHKRHKVCEIHSKTAKVIVNGIEQRFCQQCSRFHLLAEFDDGKRSCRKRLAGHNERRRKPHMRMHGGRAGRLFQSFDATGFQANAFSASSFVCQDILPSSLLHPQKYEINNSSMLVKLEDEADVNPHFTNPIANGVAQSKAYFTLHDSEKQCPSIQDEGISAITRSKINENISYLQDVAEPDFLPCSVYPSSSVGNEDMTMLGSSSTSRALSLLSSQSQSSSNHSSGVPTALPLITSGSRALYAVTQPGASSHAPAIGMSTTFCSSLVNSTEDNRLDPILLSAGGSVTSGINGIMQESAYMNSKNQYSCEDGPTINLLQLSTQLQRVEHQRRSLMMKQEDGAFSGLRST